MRIVHRLPFIEHTGTRDVRLDELDFYEGTTERRQHMTSHAERLKASALLRCTTPEEFAEWAALGGTTIGATVPAILDSFCSDCTLAYHESMAARSLCWRADQ